MYAFRQGRVFNVYSVPVTDYDNLPNNNLIQTVICDSEQEFAQKCPGVRVVSRPAAPENVVKPLAPGLLKSMLGSMEGIPKSAQDAFQSIGVDNATQSVKQVTGSAPSAPQTVLKAVYDGVESQDKALQEFRLLLARYYANPKDEKAKLTASAVGSFILKLWPDLKDALEKAKESEKSQDFVL